MGKPLIPAQRRERIQEYLAVHQIGRTADLCEMLEASEATIRRDLEWLEQKGILERTHGGAVIRNQLIVFEQEYHQKAQFFPDEKMAIGALAASLINEGDTIFIDSGTTVTQVLRHIPPHASISVFTNNVKAALDLGEAGFRYFLIGGEFRGRSNSLTGRFAVENVKQVYANKAIIGIDGISLKGGCTVPTNEEAELVRCMIERTKGQVIIVADHSKWGIVSNYAVAAINEIDVFVTDDKFAPSAIESLTEHDVKCLIATVNDPVPA